MSAKTRAIRRIKQFPTLEALIRGVADGTQPAEDAIALVDAIGMGIGLRKRDLALAKAMEDGPSSMLEDPVYATGLVDGFEACRRRLREGEDVLALEAVDPVMIASRHGIGLALTDPDAAHALDLAAKSQKTDKPS